MVDFLMWLHFEEGLGRDGVVCPPHVPLLVVGVGGEFPFELFTDGAHHGVLAVGEVHDDFGGFRGRGRRLQGGFGLEGGFLFGLGRRGFPRRGRGTGRGGRLRLGGTASIHMFYLILLKGGMEIGC